MVKRALSDLRKIFGLGYDWRSLQLDEDDRLALALQSETRKLRHRLLKRNGGNHPDPKVRAAARRHAFKKSRALRKKLVRTRKDLPPLHMITRQFVPSPLLDGMDASRPKEWKPMIARAYKSEFKRLELGPLNFLDHPIETMKQFQLLAETERSEINAFIDFADDRCQDVGAYLVLAEIWPQISPVFRGGKMPLSVQKVLSAMELDRDLGINLSGVRDHQHVSAFPIARRRPRQSSTDPERQLKPADREKIADRLVELVDGWLFIASIETKAEDALELSDVGKSMIKNMVGELLCNAERHSIAQSEDGDWSMSGFMAARDDPAGNMKLHCHLGFLNVGQSISQSMANAPQSMLDKTTSYLNVQKKFEGLSSETLMTIVALQDTVTSKKDAVDEERGGTGLQDVLEFAGDLGASHLPNSDVRVTIVSGNSCIRLRDPILAGERDEHKRRLQWCNRENKPNLPPDPAVAFELPAPFAGTLVSVGFTLDPRLLIPKENDDGQ